MVTQTFKVLKEFVILNEFKDNIKITPATKQSVLQFVQKHYLKALPSAIKAIYMVEYNDGNETKPIGMVMYGIPMFTASRFLEPELKNTEVWELKRLFLDDVNIPNLESFIISKTLKMIKETYPDVKVVLTFADEGVGHVGTIYQATNAIYLGKFAGKHKYAYILRGNLEALKKKLPQQPYPKIKKSQSN